MPTTKSLKDALLELGAESNFPPNTKFVGYVIRLPEADEFLLNFRVNSHAVSMQWSRMPHLAKIFDTQQKAQHVISQLDKPGVMVGWMFDLGSQYFVVSLQP